MRKGDGILKKGILQKATGRLVITAILALLQIAITLLAIFLMSDKFIYFTIAVTALSLIVVIHIVNTPTNPAYKLAWIIPILSFPIFGGLLYIISKGQASTKEFRNKEIKISDQVNVHYGKDTDTLLALQSHDQSAALTAKYLSGVGYPLRRGSHEEFLPSGEACFEAMKRELAKAEKYIFIESFIIREDSFWRELYVPLCEKARNGVDVRIIYDGMGSSTLTSDFKKRMAEVGIKVMVFNPYKPSVTVIQNNRDHRKIFVVDGKVAITGGVNIGDEYINRSERFGHWKDASVLISGEAAKSFALMFLKTWYLANPIDDNIADFLPEVSAEYSSSFVQPYADSPLDNENSGEQTYLNIISRATDYIYITTPYLIPDNELITALSLAAKSGVDVRIITPAIPDKWYVHMVTRSFYPELVNNGVKIYEYTPGFIHSKTVVVDGKCAVVGSVNLDYRSLFLHFECAAFIVNSPSIGDITDDFLETQSKSEIITPDKFRLIKRRHGILMSILRLFAPIF